MGSLFDIIFSASFGYAVLRVTTPILFASLGALISTKAGVVNISMEGTMLTAALAGVAVSAYTGSAFGGLVGAVIVGMLPHKVLHILFLLHSKHRHTIVYQMQYTCS